jgi:hypothetical protein
LRFTVRRPASAEVSPCCHRPSGGDVACCVDVGVAGPFIAGDALENRLALTVFWRDVPVVRASLRRISCRDEFKTPLGLVFEPGNQQSPSLAADLAVEAPFLRDVGTRAFGSAARRAGHRAHLQVFDVDCVEAARHIGGSFFHPVTATICFPGAQPRDRQLRVCPPVRAALCSGQAPLQPAQSLRFAGTKARGVEQLPAGQRSRGGHAAINTHHAAITRSRHWFGDGGKRDVPASGAIQSDAVGLHGVGYGAGPTKPHPTDLGYPYLPVAAAEPLEVPSFESDLAESFMCAGFAPRRATMAAVKKVAHRLGEIAQCLLLHSLRPGRQPVVFGPGRGQLGKLLVVPGRLSTWLPVLLLLDGQIPHEPGMATVFGHCNCLIRTGKQPKPAHTNNLGRITDNIPKGGKRRFLPG